MVTGKARAGPSVVDPSISWIRTVPCPLVTSAPGGWGVADVGVGAADAVQALLGAVIDAGDPLEAEQAAQGERQLRVEAMGIGRVLEVEPRVPIVVVEERHEEVAGLAVRGDDRPLDGL